MVKGIGTDIIEIDRVKKAVLKGGDKFLGRIFTAGEISYCSTRKNPYPCYAARFAAKEAVLKSLGTGLNGCGWKDIEIYNLSGGAPGVRLSGRAANLAGRQGVGEVLLSISHDRGRALAFAVALRGYDDACGDSAGNEKS